jgi:hypothetical protein
MSSGSVTINGNSLRDAYTYGIYNYYYSRYYSISNNTIKSRVNTPSSYYGIYSYYSTTIDTLQNNKIKIENSSTAYGMYFCYYQNYTSSYGAKGPMYIANNEIIISNSSTAYGFYDGSNSGYSRYDFYHNSIYISNASTAYGLYIYPYSSSYKYNLLNNNVYLTTSSTGYLIYFGDFTYATTSYCTLIIIIIINRVVRPITLQVLIHPYRHGNRHIARIIIQRM